MNWFTKLSQTHALRFRTELTGHHHGQNDLVLIAYLNDVGVGYIEYAEFEGNTHIQYLFVTPQYRRQGIATQLMEQLKKEAVGEIHYGMSTNEGTAFLQSMGISR